MSLYSGSTMSCDGGVWFPANMKIAWNRREFLQGAGAAFAAAGAPSVVSAQSAPVSAEGDKVSCITTTAEAPWQAQSLAKPGWRWDALNLNGDVAATAQTMVGVGGGVEWIGVVSAVRADEGGRGEGVRASCGR